MHGVSIAQDKDSSCQMLLDCGSPTLEVPGTENHQRTCRPELREL